MLAWLGVALLSVSWLPGLGYYHPADAGAWLAAVLGGTALLGARTGRLPARGLSAVSLALIAPTLLIVLWLAPWPYAAACLLLAFGLLLHAVLPQQRWAQRIAGAGIASGGILLAQALAMFVYQSLTARSHDLPDVLARLLGAVAAAVGMNVGVDDSTLPVLSMREMHRFGATWELLLDPATLCFAVGGEVLVAWDAWSHQPPGKRAWRLLRSLLALCLPLAVWLPLRAALLLAVCLQDVLRTDYEAPLGAVKLLWSSWVHLALLLPAVVLAWRFVRLGGRGDAAPSAAARTPGLHWRRPLAVVLAVAGAGLLTASVFWDPVGERADGHVLVEEFYPNPEQVWERTDKPFDTEWYGQPSGYNYYCIVNYCSRYYQVTRLAGPVTESVLPDCDVLVLKVPQRPYSPEEIDSIVRFVERGGGLLLIGEHTDFRGSGRHLNAVAERFGFRFRYDCLFGIDKVFDECYAPPWVPHPVVQHVPELDFATSCSIAPGRSNGRTVIGALGLKSAAADYHADNYYPQAVDRAEMRSGAFVQLWATRYGRGRVLAFTDSTIFSNFCTFEPGKAELMLGMLEWLNHRETIGDPRWWLAAAGVGLVLCSLLAAWAWHGAWVVLLSSALLGWGTTAVAVRWAHRSSMPLPPIERPLVQVVMDRTVCDVLLPKNGFIAGEENGFGIFERWVLRLGYFTARRSGREAFEADLLVFVYPNRPVDDRLRQQLVDYVAAGGKVLLLDSPENRTAADESAPGTNRPANRLLEPFGLSMGPETAPAGPSTAGNPQWPSVPLPAAWVVGGGEPLVWLGGHPVAATVGYGSGSVTVVGFGSRFSDRQMGITGDVIPDRQLRDVFQVQFALVQGIVEGRIPHKAATAGRVP